MTHPATAAPRSAVTTDEVNTIITAHGGAPVNLVQMLWEVQDKYSYIPPAAIDLLAQKLNLPRPQVEGTAGFYSFFYDSPRGLYNVLFSDNITDRMAGSQELMRGFMQRLGVEQGKPRADGVVTVDTTSCTGMCDQGPALLVNGYTVTRLDAARLEQMAELMEARKPLAEWPAEWFRVEDNVRRSSLLLNPIEPGGALKALIEQGADQVLKELDRSGLRGCGGAGFKTATKWTFCRNTPATERYVVCNADEGEPGTFKDRVLLQSYADLVFEGMTLCAGVIGAQKGFVYLRGEYRYMLPALREILARRCQQGLLGKNILGKPGFDFDIEIHLGAGAYVCGAELALVESLEGKRGVPRSRPPFPVTHGYLHKPTVVNNVETFALAARIPLYSGKKFAALGTEASKGTKLLSVSGDCAAPGLYEVPFGTSIQEILDMCGAEDTQAVQVSGAAGMTLPAAQFSRRVGFEDVSTGGSFMVFGPQRDLLDMVRNFADFFVHESCGFCTPCRVGGSLLRNLVEKVYTGIGTLDDLQEMRNISQIMRTSSHCGLGQTASNHVIDTLQHFPMVYHRRLKPGVSFEPAFDLDGALAEARRLTARDDHEAHL